MKPTFPTLAWNVPPSLFDTAIARGVTVLIGCGFEGSSKDSVDARRDWATAARAKGLWTIYDPQTGPVLDNQYAFLLPDEMDAKESAPKPDGTRQWNGWTREQIRPLYDAFKAKAPLPVLMSLAGDHVTQQNRLAYYTSIADCCDIWMEDGYPRNTNAVTRNEALWPGQALSVLKAAVPDKPRWAMIEAGYQGLKNSPNGRAPTASEVSSAIDIALAGGATGIGYFSHFFDPVTGGWRGFDNMPADIAAVVTARFKALNPPLPVPRTVADVDADLQKVKATLARLAAALGGE